MSEMRGGSHRLTQHLISGFVRVVKQHVTLDIGIRARKVLHLLHLHTRTRTLRASQLIIASHSRWNTKGSGLPHLPNARHSVPGTRAPKFDARVFHSRVSPHQSCAHAVSGRPPETAPPNGPHRIPIHTPDARERRSNRPATEGDGRVAVAMRRKQKLRWEWTGRVRLNH
jgi:hypothetical protein